MRYPPPIFFVLLLQLAACASEDPVPDPVPPGAAVVAPGRPVGAPVSWTFDSLGGVLSHTSGLYVTVPIRGVDGSVTVGIQELSTNVPGALQAFRVTFTSGALRQPARVTFVAGTTGRIAPWLLYVMAHQPNGTWRSVYPGIDPGSRSASIGTTSSGDWSLVQGAHMDPEDTEVALGDSVTFGISTCVMGYQGAAYARACRPIEEGEVIPTQLQGGFDMFIAPDAWQSLPPGAEFGMIRGTGTGATFIAPGTLPPSLVGPVTIQASVQHVNGIADVLLSTVTLGVPSSQRSRRGP